MPSIHHTVTATPCSTYHSNVDFPVTVYMSISLMYTELRRLLLTIATTYQLHRFGEVLCFLLYFKQPWRFYILLVVGSTVAPDTTSSNLRNTFLYTADARRGADTPIPTRHIYDTAAYREVYHGGATTILLLPLVFYMPPATGH